MIQVHALDHRRPGRESQAAARLVERRLSGLIRHIAQVLACFTFRSITTAIADAIYFDIIDGGIIVPDTMIVDGIVDNPNGVASATCRRDRRALPNDADPLPVRIN